jgi:hypothetical protein
MGRSSLIMSGREERVKGAQGGKRVGAAKARFGRGGGAYPICKKYLNEI